MERIYVFKRFERFWHWSQAMLIIGMLVTAVHAEVPLATLKGMHFAYPTFHRAIETALNDVSA